MTPPGAPIFKAETQATDEPTSAAVATEGKPRSSAPPPVRRIVEASTKQPVRTEEDRERAAIVAEFKADNPEHKREFGWIKLTDLEIDEQVQRPLVPSEVNKIAKDFNADALGTVTVSARVMSDGTIRYILIDGQQRRAGALKAGYDGQVRADVHYGLTTRDEAALFRRLNFRRAVQPVQLYKVALVEQDPAALAVQKILDDLEIPFGTPRGFSGARTALRLVVRRNGETTLRWAFTQIQKIYDGDGRGGCYDASVVEAFFHLYNHFGSRIDEDNLYEKLAKHGGGTADLIGQARSIKLARNGRHVINVIRAILQRYNAKKHAGSRAMLPDWTADEKAEKELDSDD